MSLGDQSLPELQSIDPSPFPTPEQYLQYLYPPPPRPRSWKQHSRAILSAIAAVAMIGLVIVLAIVTGPPNNSKRATPTGLETTIASAATQSAPAGHGSSTDSAIGTGAIEAASVVVGTSVASVAPTRSLAPSRTVTATKTTAARTTIAAPTPASCYPQSNGGNCYEPGQFCRAADQGSTGVSADGNPIQCEINNGLRWEPIGASVQSSSSTAPPTASLPPGTSPPSITTATSTATITASDTETTSATGSPTDTDPSSP